MERQNHPILLGSLSYKKSVADEQVKLIHLERENARLRAKVRGLFYLVCLYRELSALSNYRSKDFLTYKRSINVLLRYCDANGFDKVVWNYLPFSSKQWKALVSRKHCLNSLQGYCRKQNPQQLSIQEQETIKKECFNKEYENWPLSSIYYQLLRQQKVHCSLSTFYRYCRLLEITRTRVKNPRKYMPYRSDAALKVLHQDITIFKTTNGAKHYIYVIRDNFSRAILACKVATEYSSGIAKQTLESVLDRFDLMDHEGTLVTDDGMENKGMLDKWLCKSGLLWKKVVAQLDIIQSNSMVEAANKILKYRFLYVKPVADTDELINVLKNAVRSYNEMPNAQLHGFTPNEVLAGARPDRQHFRTQIAMGTKQRLTENRNFECKTVCQI